MANTPLPVDELEKLTKETCHSVFRSIYNYDHSETEKWNTAVIRSILDALVTRTSSPHTHDYKYVVTSTIVQHTSALTLPSSSSSASPAGPGGANGSTTGNGSGSGSGSGSGDGDGHAGGKGSGRTGMHSASGAYWDKEKDGMWSYKYDGGETRAFDVVVGVVWVGV
ncbi:hypothetical protein MMC19_006409 [Ptychographa xylographoides]|nr:hypothetical protein [Ptychographa xylographoides]